MPYKTSHMYMRNLQMEQDTRQKQRYLRCHSSSPIRLVALYLCMPYRCLRMPCSVLFVFPLCHWCAGRKDRQRGPSSGWLPPCTRQWRQLHCVIILWASTSQTLCLCAPCPCLRVPCSACLSCMLLTQSLYCRTMGTIKCGEWPNPINVPNFPTFQYYFGDCRHSKTLANGFWCKYFRRSWLVHLCVRLFGGKVLRMFSLFFKNEKHFSVSGYSTVTRIAWIVWKNNSVPLLEGLDQVYVAQIHVDLSSQVFFGGFAGNELTTSGLTVPRSDPATELVLHRLGSKGDMQYFAEPKG